MQELIDKYNVAVNENESLTLEQRKLLNKQGWDNQSDGKMLSELQQRRKEATRKISQASKEIYDKLHGRYYVRPNGQILTIFMDSEDGPEIQILNKYE